MTQNVQSDTSLPKQTCLCRINQITNINIHQQSEEYSLIAIDDSPKTILAPYHVIIVFVFTGGFLATFFSKEDVIILPSLLEDKNLEVKQPIWLGMAILLDHRKTVWSHQAHTGANVSFLVHYLNGSMSDEQQIREASPNMLFPYICKSRQRLEDQQFYVLLPFGFEEIVELESHRTSYKIAGHFHANAKVCYLVSIFKCCIFLIFTAMFMNLTQDITIVWSSK